MKAIAEARGEPN